MLTTTQVLLVSLLALYEHGDIASASPADNDADIDYYKLMYNIGNEKRGYVYDKEKRPRYDFGIGKRSLDLNRQKMYAFGLGKRNPLSTTDYDFFDDEPAFFTVIPQDKPNKERLTDYISDKQKRKYDFGLGKRGADSNRQKMYSFGLGKRNALTPNDYDLFLEEPSLFNIMSKDIHETGTKQNDNMDDKQKRRYDFGIGKRDYNNQRMYAFGLGKRNPLNSEDYDIFEDDLRDSYIKRLKPYGFGLGKRAAPAPYNFGLGKRYINEYGISQRSQRYNFGLGKRSAYNSDEDLGEEEQYQGIFNNNNDNKRSRYNFGLGKRSFNAEAYGDVVPLNHDLYTRASQKFNFGLGKREVSKDELQQLEDNTSPTLAAMSSPNLRNAIEETNSLSQHQQHSSKTKKREISASAEDSYNLQQMSIKH